MRKTLMISLALLVFVLPLSAYSVNALKSVPNNQSQKLDIRKSNKIIKKNQQLWKKQIKNADVIDSDELNNKQKFVATSLDQLKNHNKSVIEGTVYNLQKMNSPKNTAYTKATIHIDRVVSGDTSLKGKDIYVALIGGLVSFDHWYFNMSKPKDFDHEMLVNNEECPLPAIGSKIITGLVPNAIDEASEYNDSLRQSGFTINNSYAIGNIQYNLWIKNGNSDYVLNNPKVNKMAKNNNSLAKKLQKLTKEINRL